MTVTGSAQWAFKVELGDLFNSADADEYSGAGFEKVRDESVKRLRAAGVADDSRLDQYDRDEFDRLVDDLGSADDRDEFNRVLDDLFDWADTDKRMWLQTF